MIYGNKLPFQTLPSLIADFRSNEFHFPCGNKL
jgi:hypothetical protein